MDIKTAGRTLDVFEAFEALKKPMTLSELATQIGMPMSSCHGLVQTLRNRGYIYSVTSRRLYYPTKRMLDVANSIAESDPILTQLGDVLAKLCERSQETVIIGKQQDDKIVYLDVLEGPQTIRYAAKPGRIIPLHSSSIGKAMLGLMPNAKLSSFLEKYTLSQETNRTLTDPATLMQDIDACRKQGFYVTRGENVNDVMAVARPIEVASRSFGIAIAGPLQRMESKLPSISDMLIEACEELLET